MRVECPKCDARISVPEDDESSRITCPKCDAKFRLANDEDDDEEESPKAAKKGGKKSGKKRKEEEKKFPMVPVVAGGVGLLVVAGIVLAVVMLGGDKKKDKETAANTNNTPAPTNTTPIPAPGPTTPPGTNPPPQTGVAPPPPPLPNKGGNTPPPKTPVDPQPPQPQPEGIPAQYAALFKAEVPANPPPTVRGASLKPSSADKAPEVPSFHSLMMARKDAKNPNPMTTVVPKNAKLTLDELKKACVYIKVETNGGGGSGSGFLISTNGSTGLVATNHHVIADAAEARYGNVNAKVSVVFNSGLADEHSHKADIVAFDPVADVAVLRVESAKEWPKVLNPYHTPSKLTEGTAIQFWGFPLGGILSSGKKNPEITLGTGNISSFRHNDAGKLDRVQISGTMNPGNSGGPIVDGDGRLVGVAVSIINPQLGTGIGFAVPVNDLIALLEGKLLNTIFIPLELEKDQAAFLAVSPVMDPMDRVDTVFIRRWAGSKPPPFMKDPLTGFKPFAMRPDGKANLPGAEEFPLKKLPPDADDLFAGLGLAVGEVTVPLDSEQVMLQVATQSQANPQTGLKYTAASKPVSYTLKVEDLPVAKDVRPLSELTTNPDGLTGRVVTVRARIAAPPITREAVQDLIIIGEKGEPVKGIRFLVSRELATQFDEVIRDHQPLPVRLVCLVGSRGPDGLLPVRITRLDFIGRSKRVVRTIPGPPLEDAELCNLNRDPAKFAGQTLTMKCGVVPYAVKPRAEPGEIRLSLAGGLSPRNLKCTITNAMFARMLEKMGPDVIRPDSSATARITVMVPKPLDTRNRVTMPITKIEFLGAEDKVIATIE